MNNITLTIVLVGVLVSVAGCEKKAADAPITEAPIAEADHVCNTINQAEAARYASPAYRLLGISDNNGQKVRIEILFIQDKQYIRNPTGDWQAFDSPLAKRSAAGKELSTSLPLTGCKQTGTEMVNGVQTTVYEFQRKMGGKVISQHRIWIGADGLTYKTVEGSSENTNAERFFEYKDIKAPL